ncbi:MAG: hypothetical protein ABI810_09435 [Sphingomonas bacterium]
MNEIERAVVLPKDAAPLDSYGRNYTFSGPEKVVATYLIPPRLPELDEGCEVMLENLDSRPCTKKEIDEASASEARNASAQTAAGKRRWYKGPDYLPSISDGGCEQVNVEYDIRTHRVLVVACNGVA